MNPDRSVDLAGSTTGGGGTRRMKPDENDIFNGKRESACVGNNPLLTMLQKRKRFATSAPWLSTTVCSTS